MPSTVNPQMKIDLPTDVPSIADRVAAWVSSGHSPEDIKRRQLIADEYSSAEKDLPVLQKELEDLVTANPHDFVQELLLSDSGLHHPKHANERLVVTNHGFAIHDCFGDIYHYETLTEALINFLSPVGDYMWFEGLVYGQHSDCFVQL